jgi:hypothetical protein
MYEVVEKSPQQQFEGKTTVSAAKKHSAYMIRQLMIALPFMKHKIKWLSRQPIGLPPL